MTVSITTGTSPSANAVVATVTLPTSNGTSACTHKLIPEMSRANAAAASYASRTYATSTATTNFTINSDSGSLVASTPISGATKICESSNSGYLENPGPMTYHPTRTAANIPSGSQIGAVRTIITPRKSPFIAPL